jgi:penicillin-binding protein 1A
MLASILRGPEYLSPFRRPILTRNRKDIVITQMFRNGWITQAQFEQAKKNPIYLSERRRLKFNKAPYFTSYVVKQLEKKYGKKFLAEKGLRVYTTVDLDMQKYAEEAIELAIDKADEETWVLGKKYDNLGYSQAALLAIDPRTGHIKAMVGGKDFLEIEYNHTVQAQRQPGSSFKPFTYLTALSLGMSPGTVINDTKITFNTIDGPYTPKNFTNRYLGPLPLRRALEQSVNVVAIKLADLIGIHNVINTARKLGIKSTLNPILSLTLGACEVNMLEMVSAYGVIANQGQKLETTSITKIIDRNGNLIFEHSIEPKEAFDRKHILALIELMQGVVYRGTGRAAYIGRPMAGKTGTTDDYKDAWFIGFTPQLVAGCWIGNTDNTEMHRITGGSIPAETWHDFAIKALKGQPVLSFPGPYGMVAETICISSGKLATDNCPDESVSTERFWTENVPTELCNIHGGFVFGSRTGGNQSSGTKKYWKQFFLGHEGSYETIKVKSTEEKEAKRKKEYEKQKKLEEEQKNNDN